MRVNNAIGQLVTLHIEGADSTYELAGASATVDANGDVRFPEFRAVPRRYVSASQVAIPLRVSVAGATIDRGTVTLRVDPPSSTELRLVAPPDRDRIQVGVPTDLSVAVRADVGQNAKVPVANVQVTLRLPGGEAYVAQTDTTGEAPFTRMVLRSPPTTSTLRYTVGTADVHQVRVQIVAGPAAEVRFSPRPAGPYRVGQAFRVAVIARDVAGNPVGNPVRLMVAGGGAYLIKADDRATAAADTKSSVPAPGPAPTAEVPLAGDGSGTLIRYVGPTGQVQLIAESGNALDTATVRIDPGAPANIIVVQSPSPSVIADSLLEIAPTLRVTDVAGNPVPNTQVLVELCQSAHKGGYTNCTFATSKPTSVKHGFLRGTTLRRSDSLGIVRFDSLRIHGPDEHYRLAFRRIDAAKSDATLTEEMRYDADWAYNRNFVIVSAIRSIAGSVTPPDEFFDVRFRFRFAPWLHAMMYSDLSIVRRSTSDVDSVRSNTRRLVDAAVQLNYTPDRLKIRDAMTDAPERFVFLGGQFRIFNTVPYVGMQLGGVELAKSLFHGSTFAIGAVTPLNAMPVLVEGTVFRPATSNMVFDAFLRSDGFDFLKFLNIRGTLLVPLDRGRRPGSRIALAVPVGGLISF